MTLTSMISLSEAGVCKSPSVMPLPVHRQTLPPDHLPITVITFCMSVPEASFQNCARIACISSRCLILSISCPICRLGANADAVSWLLTGICTALSTCNTREVASQQAAVSRRVRGRGLQLNLLVLLGPHAGIGTG